MRERRLSARRVVRSLQGTYVVSVTVIARPGGYGVLDSVSVDGMGTVFRVPKRELRNILIKGRYPIALETVMDHSIDVAASPESREIRVVLLGGNKTWVFHDRKGFVRSELICEVWGNFSPQPV